MPNSLELAFAYFSRGTFLPTGYLQNDNFFWLDCFVRDSIFMNILWERLKNTTFINVLRKLLIYTNYYALGQAMF